MLWCLCLILNGYTTTYARFEIINAEGKYPTIVMAPAAPGSALTEETDKSSGGSAASGRNLQLASSIGSRHYDLTGANGRTGSTRNLADGGRGSTKKQKTAQQKQEEDNFIKTLQSMVTGDIVRQHSKALKESKYRKLETTEEDPFVWKFFIRPTDLESLLQDKSRLKNFVF